MMTLDISSKRRLPDDPSPIARAGMTYRANRRAEAKRRKLKWNELPRLYTNGTGSVSVAVLPW